MMDVQLAAAGRQYPQLYPLGSSRLARYVCGGRRIAQYGAIALIGVGLCGWGGLIESYTELVGRVTRLTCELHQVVDAFNEDLVIMVVLPRMVMTVTCQV